MIYTNPFYKKNNKVKINDVIKLLKIKNCNFRFEEVKSELSHLISRKK